MASKAESACRRTKRTDPEPSTTTHPGAWKSRAMEEKQRSGSYHTTTRFLSRSCWTLARTKELTDTASPIRRGYFKAGHPPGGGASRRARLLPSRGGGK